MTEDELKKEIELEFKGKFPHISISDNKSQYEQFQKTLLDFLLPLQEEQVFAYMTNRDESKSISLHVADMPQGIEYFENWFQNELISFASKILSSLKSTLPLNKVYLTFAQFLDNKNFDLFIKESKFSQPEISKLNEMYISLVSNPEFDLLMQAISCMYLGLDNSAKSLLKQWIQSLWFDGNDIQKVIDEAKAIATIRNQYSMAGKKGSSNRWEAKNKTLSFALQLAKEGNYKNNNQAAAAITERVFDFGRAVGFNFSSQFQANKTIYKWLNDSKK